jgi:TonB family protein
VVLLFWLNTRPVREFFQSNSQLPLVATKQRDSIFYDIVVVSVIPVILLVGVGVAFRYSILPRVTGSVVTLRNATACHGNRSDTVGCITPPRQTHAPQPEYPKSEQEAHHQGTVRLTLVVSSDGVPRDIAVSQTLTPDFDKAAIDAVKEWKFTPAIKDGKPIAVQIALEIEFNLTGLGRS